MMPLVQTAPVFVANDATVKVYAPLAAGQLLAQAHAMGRPSISPGPRSSMTLTSGTVGDAPRPCQIAGSLYCAGLEGLTRGLTLGLSTHPTGAAAKMEGEKGPGVKANLVIWGRC